jgi:hypothetical protein
MRTRSALALLLVLPLVGCISLDVDLRSVNWSDVLSGDRWGGGSESLTTSTRDRSSSSRVVHITRNDRIELLLLVEGSGNGSTSGGNPPSGTILTPTGRVVNWSCRTRLGKLPELRIDDVLFPFDGGRVFYIDVRDGRVLVQQLDLDPHEIATGKGTIRENLRAAAPKNVILASFCERCCPGE